MSQVLHPVHIGVCMHIGIDLDPQLLPAPRLPNGSCLIWQVLHPVQDYGGVILNGFVMTTKLGMAAFKKCYPEVWNSRK